MRMRNPGERPGRKQRTGATLLALAFVVVPLVMMLSCYPGEITSIEELDLVGTLYDPQLNYSKFHTYSMPDTVLVLDTRTPPSTESPLSKDFQALILKTVEARMTDLNYQRVDSVSVYDVGMAVGVIISDQVVVTVGYPWYGGYPGYGWPGYGYYPPVGQAYKYDTGTVIMDMLDSPTTAQDTVKVVWQGAINGLASSTKSVNQTRIIDGINQAFKQSPYLKSAGPGGP